MDALVVKDLYKAYGNDVAVGGVSFDVKDGEIFGLIGPNGVVRPRRCVLFPPY